MDTKLTYLYSYLLSIAACLMCSCTSDDPYDDPYAAKGDEMILAVGELSRSSLTTNLNTQGSRFAIYGNMKFKDYDPTLIFDKTIVSYNNNRWTYGETQYWFPQHVYSFVAMHPVDPAGISDTEYSDNRLSFTYTVPDDYKSANDLMVATHRRLYEENSSSPTTPVKLMFWHIMSRINFQVSNAGAADNLRVTKIELERVNRTGTFAITPAVLSADSRQTDDYDFSWTGISNNGTLTADIRVDIPETEDRSLFPDDNALFMIPQPDNKDVRVKITYTLIDAGANDEELTLTAESPIGGWESGKVYTYTTAISEITKEIYLTVSVKDWQAPKQPTPVTVPES